MRNARKVHLPQTMGDVISSIGIGTAKADNIRYRALARYQSSPSLQVNTDFDE